MAHQRKLIRDAVVALLRNATDAADRVKGTRVEPNEAAELPALSVYTLQEPIDEASGLTAPIELTRQLQLEVTGWVAHSDSYPVDDRMDDLAEQIELAMDADYLFGDTAADSILANTVMQVLESDGKSDPLVGIVTLTYTVTYRTNPKRDGGQPRDEFLRTNAQHRPTGAVAENQAEETFNQRTP